MSAAADVEQGLLLIPSNKGGMKPTGSNPSISLLVLLDTVCGSHLLCMAQKPQTLSTVTSQRCV